MLLHICTAVLLAAVAGCQEAHAADPGFPVTLSDALGEAVTLDARPVRIVSMAPSNTEILFGVGAGDQVVGVTTFCDYPPEAATREQVGEFSRASLEFIVSMEPDLVLAARFNPMEVLEGLRRLGIPVFALAPRSLDDVMHTIGQVGRLVGRSDRADSLVTHIKGRINRIRESVATVPDLHRPRVLWGRLQAPMYTAGPGGYINDLIELAGGKNIAADATADWPQIGLETLVARNPEIIIVSGGDADIEAELARLRKADGWRQLDAVATGRIYNIDPNLLQRPGPRIADGVELLCEALHPGLQDRHGP